jgi:hypothetical protein
VEEAVQSPRGQFRLDTGFREDETPFGSRGLQQGRQIFRGGC